MLTVTRISKSFGATPALADVDLSVADGEIHALIGENGSGKSTLIKILAGYHAADAGTVAVAGTTLKPGSPDASYSHGCRFVHQDLGLVEQLSVLDNLSLGTGFPTLAGTIRRRAARREAAEALAAFGLDVSPDTLVADLSPAVRTGVAVARALRPDAAHPPRLLVLDEPTATMPNDEVRRLHQTVRHVAASGVGVLYVSHRLEEVLELCDCVTVLRDGRRVFSGAVAPLSREQLVDQLVGPAQATEIRLRERAHSRVATDQSGPTLEVRDLRCENVESLDLAVSPGQVTGIAGITGSGRESVLPAIFGATGRDDGTVTVRGRAVQRSRPRASIRAGVAYVPPDRKTAGAMLELSARENLTVVDLKPFWRGLRLRAAAERAEARRWFEVLSVRPRNAVELPLMAFSGGNQQKVVLGKWLRAEPSVLLLDEPTQGVDIRAKALLHELIVGAADRGSAVVVSSTDVEELASLCDRVLVMRHGRRSAELTGPRLSPDSITRACLDDSQEVTP